MPDPCLTPEEREAVRAYDERTRKEIENSERSPSPPDTMKELQEALEASRLDSLRELQEDIAALLRVRERWPQDQTIKDMTDFLIRLNRYEIEILKEEIQNARR